MWQAKKLGGFLNECCGIARLQPAAGFNGRAAILNNKNGANLVYTVGNAGNGSNPQQR